MTDFRTDVDCPSNQAAEMAVLGAVLTDNEAFSRAADKICASDFLSPINQKIWETCAELIQGGRIADGVTLRGMFESDPDLASVGGAGYLANLLDSAAFGPEVGDYAVLIRELAGRRRVIAAADELRKRALSGLRGPERMSFDILEAVEQLQSLQTTIAPDRWVDSRHATVESIKAVVDGASKTAVATGIDRLDRKTGGFHRGELIVIGGRPGMGKSALADQIEMNVALTPSPDPERGSQGPVNAPNPKRMVVAKFALEMDRRQLAFRNASRSVHKGTGQIIPYGTIRGGRWTEQQARAITAAMGDLPCVNWDDTPGLTLSHMRAGLARLMKRYGRIDLITTDYLQIMEVQKERYQTDASAIGALTKGLKRLAREFDAPLIAVSALSREVEKRDNKRPQMSDLRDSGSIEADADVVLLVYREHHYLSREPEPKGSVKQAERENALCNCEDKMTVIAGKLRMNAPCDIDIYCNMATSLIVSERHELHPDPRRAPI